MGEQDKMKPKQTDQLPEEQLEQNENTKKKKIDVVSLVCVTLGAVLIVFALCQLVPAIYHYVTEESAYEEIRDEYVDVDDSVAKKENGAQEADKDWWYDSIFVDLASLQEENSEIVAWIRFDEMELSYPVLYSEENEKYLHRDITGATSNAGSLFIDVKNTPDFTDGDTIIYGHNMKNLSMFGKLKKYKKDGFYEDNQYFTIYTVDKAYRYHIFSYFDVSETSDFYTKTYQTEDEMTSLISYLTKSSYLDTDVEVTPEDKIVTLSTCSSDGNRFLVHAVLEEEHDITATADTESD